MTYLIAPARYGARAFDCLSHVSAAQAVAMRQDGFDAVGLYTALVTPEDLANCTTAGLGVFFFIEGLATATIPSADLGAHQAADACTKLDVLGVPRGATVFSDLEGAGRRSEDWIAYANGIARGARINDVAGAYFGFGTGLTSKEAYGLSATRYMHGGSQLVDRNGEVVEPSCGWCAHQGWKEIDHPCGLRIDVDFLWLDYKSRGVSLVTSATVA